MRSIFTLVILVTLCFAASSHAQYSGEGRNVFFDTIRTGTVEPRKIAIEDMRYVGTSPIAAADSTIMIFASQIVRFDLDFHADFDLIVADTFYMRTYELKELNYMGWKRLGAQYLVRLEAEFPGLGLRVRWRLFDTNTGQEIDKGVIEQTRTYWREIAHDIANAIVKTLTGELGIFRTKIAYIRQMGKAKELFISDFDGSNEQQLTTLGSISLSPAFTPDGKTIYFVTYLKGDPSLYKVDIASKKVSQVAKFPGMVSAPAISPDGSMIACVLTKDGNAEVYLLDTGGKVIRRLTDHRSIDTSPSWSPDGRSIAFTSDRTGFPQVYLVDIYGQNLRRITNEGRYNDSPFWSHRGDRVVFVTRTERGRFDVASVDTSGGNYRVLTDLGQNENPHLAPDGKHIVYSSNRFGPRDIFVIDITGRNPRRILQKGDASNPIWSPMP